MGAKLGVFGAIVLALAAAATPALAWTGRATWTTWLRAGPGLQYTVTDEISRDQVLEVLGCDGGWCRAAFGGGSGYVQAALISRDGPAALPDAAVGVACFDAKRAGYQDGEVYRYCPK